MANSAPGKVHTLFDSLAKAETDLNKCQKDVTEASSKQGRKTRAGRRVGHFLRRGIDKSFHQERTAARAWLENQRPGNCNSDLEKWLNDTTVQRDVILRNAREYIDECPLSDTFSQMSLETATVKTKSSKVSSSKASKTSSQRQRDLLIAKHKREEIERQNEAASLLARQKQEVELKQLGKKNRKRLSEAHLAELEPHGLPSEATKMPLKLFRGWAEQRTLAKNDELETGSTNSPNAPATNQEAETVVSASPTTSNNDTSVSMPFQQPPINDSQPTFAPNDINETHVTIQLPTTTAPSMSLNHFPVVQIQTPLLLAQTFASSINSKSTSSTRQPFRP